MELDADELKIIELFRRHKTNRCVWVRARAFAAVKKIFLAYAVDSIVPMEGNRLRYLAEGEVYTGEAGVFRFCERHHHSS